MIWVVMLFILATSCSQITLDVDVEGVGTVCDDTKCGTIWRIDEDLAFIAAHVHRGLKTGDNAELRIWWVDDERGGWQRVDVALVDYKEDVLILRKYGDVHWPSTRYELCRQTRIFDPALVLSAIDSEESPKAPEPDLDTSGGYILGVSKHRYLANYQSEHGYSGSPVFSGGCVVGMHLRHLITKRRKQGIGANVRTLGQRLIAARAWSAANPQNTEVGK